MARRHWLMKSEPDVFSIDDLAKKKREHWDGVRNYQARNFMRDEMKVGDEVLFYHSNAKPPGVAGLARVVKEGYPDHTAWNPKSDYHDPKSTPNAPRWFMVDVEFVEKFSSFLSLDALREVPGLEDMVLLQRSRLSVQPVTPAQFRIIVALGRRRGR
jgi:predicted RNA-binding protein with PUA-like domain